MMVGSNDHCEAGICSVVQRGDLVEARRLAAAVPWCRKSLVAAYKRCYDQVLRSNLSEYFNQVAHSAIYQNSSLLLDFATTTVTSGDSSHLLLPAISEIAIRLALSHEHYVTILQAGFFDSFNLATTLWPAGYLLAQHLYKSTQKNSGNVLVLGSGVGLDAIALCRHQNSKESTDNERGHIYVTDIQPQALALAVANVHLNCLPPYENIHFDILDWSRNNDAFNNKRFDLIIGAALQFEDPKAWPSPNHLEGFLDRMLSVDNHQARIMLAHSIYDTLILTFTEGKCVAGSEFFLLARISGDEFGMTARYASSSEFVVSVLARRRHFPSSVQRSNHDRYDSCSAA